MPFTYDETGALLIRDVGGDTFIGLTDTPAPYAGNASRMLAVNAAANAVIFGTDIYWDEANSRLGIGTNVPNNAIDIKRAIPKIRLNDSNTIDTHYALVEDGGAALNLAKHAATGTAQIKFDPMPDDNLGNATIRLFRLTNTVGTVAAQFYRGDASATLDNQIGSGASVTFFSANRLSDVAIGTSTPSVQLHVVDDSAVTSAIVPIVRIESQVSGGAGAAGHGPAYEFYGETTTTEDTSMAQIAARWSVATHASRRARYELRAAFIGTDVLCAVIEAPANASADGNARGVGAVDLQGNRSAATQVSSGIGSVLAGGALNTSSNTHSTCSGGTLNVASGARSVVPGGFTNVASGALAFAAGQLATASHDDCFVWSSAAATVSWGNNTFTVRCHGGARFYSAAGVGTGVQLTTGGAAWAAISTRASKENFRPVENILEKVAALPVYNYNMKAQAATVRHIGPVAEEFNEIFEFTEAPGYINTLDLSGINLAAIKALLERVEKLEAIQ